MNQTLKATFTTRREAELVVERLVQEHDVERSDIFMAPEGPANSAGETISGSDREAGAPSEGARDDGAHEGRIEVSVDLQDDERASAVQSAFHEFGGQAA
ncbi:hypothetical protein [Brevundimonas sp.]|uniref:hypothetical protein n=1 Tax=Brevundimonas sp. TaxID=1871086 RepID=UPI00356532C8